MSRGRVEIDLRGRLSFLPPNFFGVVISELIIHLSTEFVVHPTELIIH